MKEKDYMYIDILGPPAYLLVNKKAIQLFGIETAAYVSVLVDIIPHALHKKTVDESGAIVIDRSYVEQECGISPEEQYKLDKKLSAVEIIKIDKENPDKLNIYAETFANILVGTDTKTGIANMKKIFSKKSKEEAKVGKETGIKNRLIAQIKETDPELRDLYVKLVDVFYAKGKMTNAQITLFEDSLNSSVSNKADKAEILRTAIERGYTVVEWAINCAQTSKSAGVRIQATQNVCTELSTDEVY